MELYFRCLDIHSAALFSKPDTYVMLEVQHNGGPKVTGGQTEIIKNEVNPVYLKCLAIEFEQEEDPDLIFSCFDEKGDRDELMGLAKCKVSELISYGTTGKKMRMNLPTSQNKKDTWMIVRCNMCNYSKLNYVMVAYLNRMQKVQAFNNESPFIKIFRPTGEYDKSQDPNLIKNWTMCYESEHQVGKLNAGFMPFDINSTALCREDEDSPIRFEVWDFGDKGDHKFAGVTHLTLTRIRKGDKIGNLRDLKGQEIGELVVDKLFERFDYDLKDYLIAGLKLEIHVAIDFTASNGPYKNPMSLHHISKRNAYSNEYTEAIERIVGPLLSLAENNSVRVSGFGAKVDGRKSDFFSLSGEGVLHVQGVSGILEAYRNMVPKVELFGPTNFAPTIKNVQMQAREHFRISNWNYKVLVMFTDGILNDVEETRSIVASCSNDPVSILIVGVGNEDFKEMKVLDGDDKKLKGATRDLVQFMKFRDYAGLQGKKMARVALNELPTQVDIFYRTQQIKPY
jgi:Copine/C2 domain